MKNLKALLFVSLLALLSFTFVACDDDSTVGPESCPEQLLEIDQCYLEVINGSDAALTCILGFTNDGNDNVIVNIMDNPTANGYEVNFNDTLPRSLFDCKPLKE